MAKESTPKTTPTVSVEEPIYEATEIAANAPSLFGHSVDIATAALDYNHLTKCTLNKAKQVIKEFAERKV